MSSYYPVLVTLVTKLSIPRQQADSRSDKLLSDQKFYITHRIVIVRRISPKRFSKSYIALFLSNTHLRRFYSLVNYGHYPLLVTRNPQFLHKLLVPRNMCCILMQSRCQFCPIGGPRSHGSGPNCGSLKREFVLWWCWFISGSVDGAGVWAGCPFWSLMIWQQA